MLCGSACRAKRSEYNSGYNKQLNCEEAGKGTSVAAWKHRASPTRPQLWKRLKVRDEQTKRGGAQILGWGYGLRKSTHVHTQCREASKKDYWLVRYACCMTAPGFTLFRHQLTSAGLMRSQWLHRAAESMNQLLFVGRSTHTSTAEAASSA